MDSESTEVTVFPERGAALEEILTDLALLLTEGRALYLSLDPKGAVLAVKSPVMYAFGESHLAVWSRMSPREQAEFVLDWMRRAAVHCRQPRIRFTRVDDLAA